MFVIYQITNHDYQNYQIKPNQFRREENVIQLKDKYGLYHLDLENHKPNSTLFIWIINLLLLIYFTSAKLIVYPFIQFIFMTIALLEYRNLKDFVHILSIFKILNFFKNPFHSSSTKKLKSLFFIILLFPMRPVYSEQKISNKTLECDYDSYDNEIEYDENLFNELNMQETLIHLYRSCYKDKFHESRLSKPIKSSQNSCNKRPSPKKILKGLLFNEENQLIPDDILESINEMCSGDKVKNIDKIWWLANFDDKLCGNVYRNSIKTSHLNDYILEINSLEKTRRGIATHHHHNRHHSYIDNNENFRRNHIKHRHTYNYSDLKRDKINIIENSVLFKVENNSNFTDFNLSSARPKRVLNNCTLILLNIYLLSHTASCDFEDFVESLNHFDCLSNYFSVKSDCHKCQDAYKKWLCSSIIPFYHEDNKMAKPCQRFCYSVQNLCPFFRPVDNYGGQPVFHCRNVVQVIESRPDGYEDDDENYFDDDLNDDDRCYGECTKNMNQVKIDVTLNSIFKKKLLATGLINESFIHEMPIASAFDIWNNSRNITDFKIEKLFQMTRNSNNFNSNGRFKGVDECLFGFQP
ncbi:unnamed protein product, partial [Brachionus calyciflorus]